MDSRPSAFARIRDFAEESRVYLRTERCAASVHVGDVSTTIAPRKAIRRPGSAGSGAGGEIEIRKPLSDRFGLLIRHNARFAALLPLLTENFTCLALVRSPLSLLGSWQTVALPVHRGPVPAGEVFDFDLHRRLEEESYVLQRQLIVLDRFFARYDAHPPPECISRYEDLVESGCRWAGPEGTDADPGDAGAPHRQRRAIGMAMIPTP